MTKFFIAVLFLSSFFANAQKISYDSVLAKKLGADQYGMKKYVMVFLKAGPVKIENKDSANAIQKAHLNNIIRLANEGKLVIAGPFLDNQTIRGIFIFNVPTVEEAQKLTATDPAVKAGILTMEMHPWYGSASLLETYRIHKSLEAKSVAD